MQRLFNKKTIKSFVDVASPPKIEGQTALKEWAAMIASGRVRTLSETELQGQFMQKVCIEGLGYKGPVGHDDYSVTQEKSILQGSVDLAFGHFNDGEKKIIAPFELKGADTKNLDAIMSSRAKSPVDQAWEYANNNVGTKWVLISNYLEIRLYSYAEGRQFYETFDLKKLHEEKEYQRLHLLLAEENLLSGRTAELLERSQAEDKDISEQLYAHYKKLRHNLIGAVGKAAPDMDHLEAIGVAQTILDRVLFIAFAEDNKLIPDGTIGRAYESNSDFNPQPVWQNFLGLFRAIDEGNEKLDIPRYNGGLFSRDEVIRSLKIPDLICEGFKDLATYDFASEVPVTVLGRIFEQSISDIETLQKQARGEEVEEKKSSGATGRRKRDGVVYTPDYVARFIVEQTIGAHLREIFDGLLGQYAAKGASADDEPIKWKSKKAEKQAWEKYRQRIAKLRIVDPACGSGVFLVMAFDFLKAELTRVNNKISELTGEGGLYQPDSDILTNNLFGVDVNSESVEITKLSLWIKTARHGKVLDSLNDNFKVGDSLIEDSNYAYREHGFVWKDAFPEIFDEGGFDIVLGNPPYVRQELLENFKPYFKTRFEVFGGYTNLYGYFFERGIKLLKTGGRLGYISSNTFFKIKSGKPVRKYLSGNVALENVIDFGDYQVFEGVSTYTTIITFQKIEPAAEHEIQTWLFDDTDMQSFDAAFEEQSLALTQAELNLDSWSFQSYAVRNLETKMRNVKTVFVDMFPEPRRGVVTGCNAVFCISTEKRDQLVEEHSSSNDVIFPWLEGEDIKSWGVEPRNFWIVFTQRGIDIEKYPAVKSYLSEHRDQLEPKPDTWKPTSPEDKWPGRKSGTYRWFEIQDSINYSEQFLGSKIVYGHFSPEPLFSIEKENHFGNDKTYIIPTDDKFLLAYLHSSSAWFLLCQRAPFVRGKYYELRTDYIKELPIPEATPGQKTTLATLAEQAQTAAEARYAVQQSLTRRIPDLIPEGATRKMSGKLKSWWELPDFKAFQAAVKKDFKTTIPVGERNDWEKLITDGRSEINKLSATIKSTEDKINALVYELFELTAEEIELLEANI